MFSGLPVVQEAPVRRWTALASFTLQAAAVAALLVAPLLYPQRLTSAFTSRRVFAPVSYADVNVTTTVPGGHTNRASPVQPLVVSHGPYTFRHPDPDNGSAAPPDFTSTTGIGDPTGVRNAVLMPNVSPVPRPPEPSRPIRRSVVMEGNLVHRVEPQYPLVAKQLRIRGAVIVKAVISREGTIDLAQVVSGPALLAPAALAAIRQWRYRPYFLNGDPVEVETQITVNFVLQR
jgi:periplasmic protein TonB